jgi:hypothetical protein
MSTISGAATPRLWLARAFVTACLPAGLVARGGGSEQLAGGGIVGTGAVLKASKVEFA